MTSVEKVKTDHIKKPDHINKTKRGLKWSFINHFGSQAISIAVSIFLARLIDPSEFGLLGMVTIFIGFASIFVDFGFSSVLIQKENVSKEDLNTVFTCNLFIGILLYCLFFFLAPLLSSFFDEPRLTLITRVVSLSFLIAPLNSGRSAMISKQMNFKLSAKISLLSLCISSFIAIIMAFYGFGVWSIICQSLIGSSITAIYYRNISDYKPSLKFNHDSFRSMISMSSALLGDSIINYWTRNADNLLVGKFLGKDSLGIYSRAYALMVMPITNITRVIVRVMLPSFSLIKNDTGEIKRIYLRVCETIAAITFPMMFGLSAASEVFVLAVFGNNWHEMIPLVQVLSIIGAFQSILAMNGSIYVSLGKAKLAFKVTLAFNLFFLGGFLIGLYYGGLNGIALSYLVTSLIALYPNFYFAANLINVRLKDMYHKVGKILLASVFMSISVFAIDYSNLISNYPVGIRLLIIVISGMLIYLLLIYLMNIKIYDEFKTKLIQQLGFNKYAGFKSSKS